MQKKYIEDQKFESLSDLELAEYECCTFVNCTCSESNLESFVFMDCEFINCDLSNANIQNASFQGVKFVGCKLLGMQFSECNTFSLSFSFKDSILDFSSFYKLKIKSTIFDSCRLHQVDFINTDLSKSMFLQCDLSGAQFENTNLQKADFQSAVNFNINPAINKVEKAIFSHDNLQGLLYAFNIKVV